MTLNKTGIIFRLCAALVALTCVSPAYAQNNEYKINDSLYEIFMQAHKVRHQPEALALGDSMYYKAMEIGDKKAQCIAKTIPVTYYSNTAMEDSLQNAIVDCHRIARLHNYLQYYYYASSSHITWLLNRQKYLKALQLSKEMLLQAMEDKDDYGIIQSYRMQGHIHAMRRCYDFAIENYSSALEHMLAHRTDQDPASLYERLATCYIDKGKQFYPTAMQNIEKGIQSARTYHTRMGILMTKCWLLYLTDHLDEFRELYLEIDREMDENGIVNKARKYNLDVCYLASRKEYGKAFALADSLFGKEGSYSIKSNIARSCGDYRKAYEYATLESLRDDSIVQDIQALDVAEASAEMDLLRLEQQNEILTKSKRYTYIICLTLVVGLIILFILLHNKRKYNKTLQGQNKELAKAREIAESSNRMKDAFVHNMSHEIRTPLNAIVGISQLFTMQGVEISAEEKDEYKNIICHNAELLTTLVNDILDLAALENGKYAIKKGPIRCNELCRLTISSVKHRCPANVRLYFTTDLSDDVILDSDEKRIRQVLTNFIGNSMKHTEQGEIHLHLGYSEQSGEITFSVADTGPGVPEDKIPMLFDRFAKLNTDKPGTGLGLNICRVIADLLGGSVSYDRTYTAGARFIFTLPLSNPDPENA